MNFDQQSSKDLEFDVVCELLSTFCKSQKAKANAMRLSFFDQPELLNKELDLLVEIQTIHNDERLSFPHPNAEDIDTALNILRIENGVLILSELIKVYSLCQGTKLLIDFARNQQEDYPIIYAACEHITGIKDVLKIITEILDTKKLNIKDDATPRLQTIRRRLKANKSEINKNFEKALRRCKQDELLGDSEESFLENRRLLAVLSQYKKRVPGKIYGVSAKGTYTYIEPQESVLLNKEQEQLRMDESNEIFMILEKVTLNLRAEKNHLKAFQRLLIRFDLLSAKVLFAKTYNGIRPGLNKTKRMHWKNATHPLLYLKNQIDGISTIGQEMELSEESRFLVISGPNAGGKSITLKTVGLLQMMFQCGLFLSMDEDSNCAWFNQIFSDIGDNQSIENQLSTYSYRLNRMNFFLENANSETLLLLDEFGSGSDPELGGAIAEVFYTELYEKDCYAVITTHYTNIKILTSSLAAATNACMLFDTKKLEPLFQLSIGQPGSSFTFEVAQHNGIPLDLIEKAKAKVSDNKLQVDALTVSLQKEKSKFKKINSEQYKSQNEAKKALREYEAKLEKLQDKSDRINLYIEQQNKFVTIGKKFYEILGKFKHHKTNKATMEALKKLASIEKSKILEAEKPVVLAKNLKNPDLPDQTKKKAPTAEEIATAQKKEAERLKKALKIGEKIKLKNQNTLGTLLEVNGKKLTVQLGNFIVKTTVAEVEI
ncbi:MAG: DNA mismatch repair protein MutS [Crocinitomix sp.]|nr:DNA mismatch repair protein MutS [Crocinitomix sp.]